MEYRLKYRDIPWSVALAALPGKIIGTFFIKPWLRFKRDYRRILHNWMMNATVCAVVLLVIALIMTLVNIGTDGKVIEFFAILLGK
jgi:hypothetical protein